MASAPPDIDYWSTPRCWPGEAVAILAGGKTLTQEDVDHVRGKCRVVAINRAYRLAPWGDWLYGTDADERRFWGRHGDALAFEGVKIAVRPAGNVTSTPARWPIIQRLAEAGVKILRHTGRDYPQAVPKHEGASPDPAVVYGNNSLFQVLSVIAHTGAATVILLGADMRGGHWHGGYGEAEPDYDNNIVPKFATLVRPLEKAGVVVLNACPTSAIPYWPRVALRSVI